MQMEDPDNNLVSQISLIGCCGAYCKPCRPFLEGFCKGCKFGYAEKKRDINAARCRINLCCFKEKNLETCADCPDYPECRTIHDLHGKKGYKYGKYRQSIEFIRKNGYPDFLKRTGTWKCAYGKL